MTDHQVVSRQEWQAAREELLQREKEHTRMADELACQRRELPWVAIEKEYRFDTDDGRRTLAGLFDGRSQLLFYHFMFGPSYEAGCPVNSSMADGLDGLLPHLHARDVTLLLVSQAPLAKLQAYKQRMGWSLPWISSANTDFNVDFGGSHTEEQVRSWGLDESGLPPIVALNAAATGADDLDGGLGVLGCFGQAVELAPHHLAAAGGAVQDALVEDAPELGRARSVQNCLAGQAGGYLLGEVVQGCRRGGR